MATSRALAPFWTLRKRLIKHKSFLVQIAEAKSNEERITILKQAEDNQLRALKALIKGIVEKKITISRHIFNQLEESGKIPYLLRQFKKTSDIYQDQKRLS